nr:hypothetical protein [uncultured Oscillibacter sp.]
MTLILGISTAIGILIYLLHRQGFAVTKSIAAVLFVFQPGKRGGRASLNSCTGWVRHRGRFRKSWIMKFCFDCRLSSGDAEVVLLDSQKRELLRLNRHQSTGELKLDGTARYYLQWEFHRATGICELHW